MHLDSHNLINLSFHLSQQELKMSHTDPGVIIRYRVRSDIKFSFILIRKYNSTRTKNRPLQDSLLFMNCQHFFSIVFLHNEVSLTTGSSCSCGSRLGHLSCLLFQHCPIKCVVILIIQCAEKYTEKLAQVHVIRSLFES